MGHLFEVMASQRELSRAWRAILGKGGSSPGVDGVTLSDFASSWNVRIESLHRELITGKYEPTPLVSVRMPKKVPGQWREIGIPTIGDRVVFHSMVEVLHYLMEPVFLPSSFAFRQGYGVQDAISSVIGTLREVAIWAVRGDIRGCFDSLSWDILSGNIRRYVPDPCIKSLLNKAIRIPYVRGRKLIRRSRGVPQGTGFSPVLANMYLHHFDQVILEAGFRLIRYGDDWMILFRDEREARKAYLFAARELAALEVEINGQKSGVVDLSKDSVTFLGFKIGKGRIDGDSSAWRRALRCSRVLRSQDSSKEKRKLARSELCGIKKMYKNTGHF